MAPAGPTTSIRNLYSDAAEWATCPHVGRSRHTFGATPATMNHCPACMAELPGAARFCPGCGRSTEARPADERRPVTILFLDIVGSTAIAERLDAEDWKAIVDPALARFTETVERHGGRVAQLLGDGLLAFFGAPVAHEDDPIRAVRAGLELVELARDLGDRRIGSTEFRLEVRVGINSGEVVVGGVGAGGRQEYLAVGDAVNVAARLQSAASPMSVLVSAETHDLVAGAVDGRPVGPLALKGKALPTDAFEISALRAGTGRGRRLRDGGALVGREGELRRLASVAESLRSGVGSVVTVVGEPGLGKTRLLIEWARVLRDPAAGLGDVRWIEAGCRTDGRDLPYHLAGAILRRALGLGDDAGPADGRRAVAAAAGSLPGSGEIIALLAWLLGLPRTATDEVALAGLDGRAVQHRATRAARALVEAMAAGGPVVLIAEDIHWIDPSSAEVLAELLPAVVSRSIVVCITRRPEETPAVGRIDRAIGALPDTSRVGIHLVPLDESGQRLLVGRLLGEEAPEVVRAMVRQRCDGNPLFVEELIETLLERGLLRRQEGAWSIDPGPPEAIPPSLQGLLLARLDALPPPVRRLGMIASVIGRRCSFEVLRAVALEAGETAAAAASHGAIEAGGLLQREGSEGEILAFRHALVHDAAYSAMVRADRRRLHGIVGRLLEREAVGSGRVDEAAATLAYHFGRAQDHEPAVRHGRAAAERAAAGYANAEAIGLYETAIASARALLADERNAKAADDRRALLVDLLEAQGWLVRQGGGYAEAEAIFRDASALVPAESRVRRARWLLTLGTCASDRKDFGEEAASYQAAEDLLGAPPLPDDPVWWATWIDVRMDQARRAYWVGRTAELERLIESLEEPVRLHGTPRQEGDLEGLIIQYLHRRDRYCPSEEVMRHALARFAAEIRVGNRGDVAWARFSLGFAYLWNLDLAHAERELRAALDEAQLIGDVLLVARSITYLSVAVRRAGREAEVRDLTERVIAASRRLGIDQYVAIGLANRAWVALRAGDTDVAGASAEAAALTWPDSPPLPFRWLGLWPAIAVDLAHDRPVDAIPRCRQLLDPAQQPPSEPVAAALGAVLDAAERPGVDLRPLLGRALERARQHTYL
jgi:class 3 adenylate cyclase